MIYSENTTRRSKDFATVLDEAVDLLKTAAAKDAEKYLQSGGTKLEGLAHEAILEKARGTEFENTIMLVSGQRFPDLISKGGFGVEVKSTRHDHWKTIGNSVLESTRIESVKRIFLLFGKLARPVDFKVRPYEECMADVVVSHYPRYSIDMELKKGQTIFDKIDTSYDDVRKSGQSVALFARYYKSQLKSGGELWWANGVDNDVGSASVPFMVKMWSDEETERRKEIQAKALALFPEILGNSTVKYANFAMWLVREFGIISTNVRDIFTAGGQVSFRIGMRNCEKVRKVVALAIDLRCEIAEAMDEIARAELALRWDCELIEGEDRIGRWLHLLETRSFVTKRELELLRSTFLSPKMPIERIYCSSNKIV